jgi:dephospho-CoA kinase
VYTQNILFTSQLKRVYFSENRNRKKHKIFTHKTKEEKIIQSRVQKASVITNNKIDYIGNQNNLHCLVNLPAMKEEFYVLIITSQVFRMTNRCNIQINPLAFSTDWNR